MKIDIRDVEAVRALQPVDAALYLRAGGWESVESKNSRVAIWAKTVEQEEYEVLLPMEPAVGDYALRMGELLQVLSVAEKRSQNEVYRDLLSVSTDVIRIRIADPELSDGTIPIEEHALIAQKARDLILAGACAATESRAVWHKRKPQQAIDHVRRVRIGQTERGSYVVTVMSRVPPELHGQVGKLFETDTPYERRVTETLANSLFALNNAAQQAAVTQTMAAFDEAVPLGVNSNLCEAVAGLWAGDETQRNLEISFSWAPARPVAAGMVRKVLFSQDRLPIIREAARQLRERAPITEFELIGPVLRLERGDGAATGMVTVIGMLDGRPIRIAAELGDPDYHNAVQAHDQGKAIRMFGTLQKEGRGFSLRQPSEISVVEE